MSSGSNLRAYRTVEVEASTPGQRIVILYDHLLARLRRARVQIDKGDVAGKAQSLTGAGDIVLTLAGVIDFERAGEAGQQIAANLEALSLYFSTMILEINRNGDLDKLDALITMVESLHEAWVQAEAQTRASA